MRKYGNVIDVINTNKEFDSHILQNLRNVKEYTFKDPGLIISKKGEKNPYPELVLDRGERKTRTPGGGITGNLGAEWSGLTFLSKYSNMKDPE